MANDKSLIFGSTSMLILKLLENYDMYGYQMIEELSNRSNDVFNLKAGTLYPLLHSLEKQESVTSYDKVMENSKTRKYYSITKKGRKILSDKEQDWNTYTKTVNQVLKGGSYCGSL